MVEKQFELKYDNLFFPNIATYWVQSLEKFSSRLQIQNINLKKQANAKSLLGILAIESHKGDCIKLIAEGSDEQDALECMERLLTETQEEIAKINLEKEKLYQQCQ